MIKDPPQNPNREYEEIINDKSRYSDEDFLNSQQKEYKRLWTIYNANKEKPWTPFVYCPIISFFLALLVDHYSIGLLMVIFSFIWVPIASYIAAYKVHKNDKLRDHLGINSPELKNASGIEESSLIIIGTSTLKNGGKMTKGFFTPQDKDI